MTDDARLRGEPGASRLIDALAETHRGIGPDQHRPLGRSEPVWALAG